MPINKNQSTRLFYTIEVLKNAPKPLTKEELISKVESKFELDGMPITISDRTFYRDLDLLSKTPFLLDIQHQQPDGYRLLLSTEDTWDVTKLLEPFHLLNTLDVEDGLQNILLAQSYSKNGTEWLRSLINAIRTQKITTIFYKKHHEEHYQERILEPYYIKEFNGKWYLIAFEQRNNGFRTFGLDRIEYLSISKNTFKKDLTYDVRQQFQDSYGIYSDPNYPIEEIVFKVDAIDTSYLQSNPLHHSQSIIMHEQEKSTFLLRVRYTKDLLMALLSRCWSMEIISPAYVRDEYAAILKQAYERNK